MASKLYSYFVSYQIHDGLGRVIQQKNCFMDLKQTLSTEQDVKKFVKDLEDEELLSPHQSVFLISFTLLAQGENN